MPAQENRGSPESLMPDDFCMGAARKIFRECYAVAFHHNIQIQVFLPKHKVAYKAADQIGRHIITPCCGACLYN